ncbi:DNA-binding response regulator [Dehalogenimonas sp. WBC-2]|nr:DNA-binding response regulator [Dehalogenimonas sp. WBC-2]
MRILLVEDDTDLVWAIKSRMEQDGYAVDHESDGPSGLNRAADTYDVIILDIMLPGLDGFEVCRRIRSQGIKTPILMLTARSREDDKVRGLDCGADDYLAKPFSYPELFARVRALIRRSHNHLTNELIVGPLHIDIALRTAAYHGRELILTSKEYGILEYLTLNRNAVVTKDMIEQHIWGDDNNIYSNVIEVLVSRVRNKLDPENKEAVIKTVRSLGYIIKNEKP